MRPEPPQGAQAAVHRPRERDRIRSEFRVSTDHVGLGAIVHGGIVATIFDEAMVWALYRWRYQPHLTARMEQRFRGMIEADTDLVAEAWISADRGKRRTVEAVIHPAGRAGRVLAEATGIYLPAAPSALEILSEEQRLELEAVFTRFRNLDGAADGSN